MLEWCAEARAIGFEHAMAVVEHMLFPGWSGAAMVAHGEYKEGRARLSSGLGVWQEGGGVLMVPQHTVVLAQAYLGMGQTEQAEALVRDAIELIDRTGHRMYEVEAHRVLGEVLLNGTRRDEGAASKAFLKALEVAKSQQAKCWERAPLPAMRVSCDRRDD
jgi:predicted ATPase